LCESPLIKYFEYGYRAGKEGYWAYDHMSLPFEDCVDVIQAYILNLIPFGCLTTAVAMIVDGRMD
jgi:hypothetical protein